MNHFVNAELKQTVKISRIAEDNEKFKAEVIIAIGRFFNNDWGDVCDEDKEINEDAIKYYEMVVACYETSVGEIWITGESEKGQSYDKVVVSFADEH